MRKTTVAAGAMAALFLSTPLFAQGAGAVMEEIENLKKKIERLEADAEKSTRSDAEIPWYKKVDIAFGATGIVQGTPDTVNLTGGDNVIDGSMSLDLELGVMTSNSGRVFAHFEAGGGNGLDADVPTFSGFNADADDDNNLRPTELWYEHSWGDKLRLRGGKIDLTTDFDTSAVANCEMEQFISPGFVNNPAVAFPDDNGLGAMLWFSPSALWDIGIAFADADADWDNVFRAPFTMGELVFKPQLASRQGNYRVYGWHNGKDHTDFTRIAEGAQVRSDKKANYGFGFSLDQEIGGGVTVFARYGRQRAAVAEIAHAWSAGLQLDGQVYGRQGDVLGLAYGQTRVSDWLRATGAGNEHHLEIYYKIKTSDHLSLSPHLQWVKNPAGEKHVGDVRVIGLRAQLSF